MARVDLSQYAAFLLEENLFYAGETYNNLVVEISNDLRHGIQGLSLVMEHFSFNGYADSLPLSVLVSIASSAFYLVEKNSPMFLC
jgi:hypothetical protein